MKLTLQQKDFYFNLRVQRHDNSGTYGAIKAKQSKVVKLLWKYFEVCYIFFDVSMLFFFYKRGLFQEDRGEERVHLNFIVKQFHVIVNYFLSLKLCLSLENIHYRHNVAIVILNPTCYFERSVIIQPECV